MSHSTPSRPRSWAPTPKEMRDNFWYRKRLEAEADAARGDVVFPEILKPRS